jgi:hypothetical protein
MHQPVQRAAVLQWISVFDATRDPPALLLPERTPQ